MDEERIPSLTDKEWANENEIGSITRVLEYIAKDGNKSKVEVTARIISGEEIEAIEAECSNVDFTSGPEAKIDIDSDKFTKMRTCRTFGIDIDQYDAIMRNKSDDLRNQMILLSTELSGSNLSEEEIETEKNLERPVSPPTT
jgi:hypothetical protein